MSYTVMKAHMKLIQYKKRWILAGSKDINMNHGGVVVNIVKIDPKLP